MNLKPLDKKWSELVINRDGCCRNCGKTDELTPAHIIKCGHKTTRWILENGITLCVWCHSYFEAHPDQWKRWVIAKIGEWPYRTLVELSKDIWDKNVEHWKAYLERREQELSHLSESTV